MHSITDLKVQRCPMSLCPMGAPLYPHPTRTGCSLQLMTRTGPRDGHGSHAVALCWGVSAGFDRVVVSTTLLCGRQGPSATPPPCEPRASAVSAVPEVSCFGAHSCYSWSRQSVTGIIMSSRSGPHPTFMVSSVPESGGPTVRLLASQRAS